MKNNIDEKLVIDDAVYVTRLTKKYKNRKKYVKPDPAQLTAFIPGTIREIFVKPGDKVKWGDTLFILEAMKMKNFVKSPRPGTIKVVMIKEGDTVMKNQLLLEFDD
jgi:biotin carboxyl carrier protein